METEKKSHGALIGSIIIIVLLIIGGIYIWQTKVKQIKNQNQPIELQNETETIDLNALDQELNTIDTNIEINSDNIE